MSDMTWGILKMTKVFNAEYYLSRKKEIMELYYDLHARAWEPFLVLSYGHKFTEAVLQETRSQYEEFIPTIPYIGGNENWMTHHLIRSTTGLILYKVMKAKGKTAYEVGKIVYGAVEESVKHIPQVPGHDLTTEFRDKEIKLARKSQERRWSDDWVWEFVEGDGAEFDYGYDFIECGAQKIYHTLDADEFLPYFCYLDFAMARTPDWGFTRTETLAEWYPRCNPRMKKGGVTEKGWPPPFVRKKG
jgi:hypothetical protein